VINFHIVKIIHTPPKKQFARLNILRYIITAGKLRIRIIPKKNLFTFLNKFLGNLYICCKVEIDCYNSNDNLQNTYANMLNDEIFTDCVFKVYEYGHVLKPKISNFLLKIDFYKNLKRKKTITSFKFFQVGDEVIKAHKCILAKNSKVFHKMFEQNGMTEAQNASFY